MSENNVVPVSEMDYLEEDAPIRGQNFACVSFISPEKVLDDKKVFAFTKFTQNFCKEVNELFQNMKIKYPDDDDAFKAIADRYRFLFNEKHMQEEFKYFEDEKEDEINREFSEKVNFQTNVRGFKLRGCYDTLREAQVRSEILKRKDKQHNIYITQVGCWCPWDPNPNNIDDQHYAEDQLNTLMKKYRENQQQKDEIFENRKNEMLEAQKAKVAKSKELADKENVDNTDNINESENVVLNSTAEDVAKTVEDAANTVKDVAQTVKDVEGGNVVAGATDVVKDVEDVKEIVNDVEKVAGDLHKDVKNLVTSSGVGEDNTVSENYNAESADVTKMLDGEDPWLSRKNQ
tara:strand:+ start:1823 stop:2860 length:1038 start_codon:yes stop_codon:yes gene_type:complete